MTRFVIIAAAMLTLSICGPGTLTAAEPLESAVAEVGGTTRLTGAAPIDLAGRWLLTLPAGYQYRVTIERLDDGRYRFPSGLAFAGIYRLDDTTMAMDEPEDERLDVFDWKINNVNNLTLVEETGRTGARYAGATLGRQVDWADESFPMQIARVGTVVARPLPTLTAPRSALDQSIGQTIHVKGRAHNDDDLGPYVETEEDVILVKGIETWPDEADGEVVELDGVVGVQNVRDGGEQLRFKTLTIKDLRLAE